jgi:hypothetical protein
MNKINLIEHTTAVARCHVLDIGRDILECTFVNIV